MSPPTTNGRASEPADAPRPLRGSPKRSIAARRVLLAALSALVAVSIWTGAPWLALWVGSRLVSQTSLSMRGVVIVLAVLAAVVFALTLLLTWIDRSYMDLADGHRSERPGQWIGHVGEEPAGGRRWRNFTAVERVVVLSVYLAVATLLAWFFFFAGSPLPQ